MDDINKRCFWLKRIRGQGSTEYYCDFGPGGDGKCECRTCLNEIDQEDAEELIRAVIYAVQRRF